MAQLEFFIVLLFKGKFAFTKEARKFIRAYSNIGTHKLREITDKDDKQLVLWVGSKRLIKRKALEKYIDQSYSI